MPVFGPIKRKDLIRCLKALGFAGPYAGGKHQYMLKDELRLTIPNPHKSDISKA
jgi:predicted RNA binding protein YcfA (HicA-like mRNA interferase family)